MGVGFKEGTCYKHWVLYVSVLVSIPETNIVIYVNQNLNKVLKEKIWAEALNRRITQIP